MVSTRVFFEAVKGGELAKVKKMVETDPSLAKAKTADGVSAIIYAAYYGRKEIANYLAGRRGDLDIFEAAVVGKTEQVLLQLCKNPELVNVYATDGFTPLHFPAFFGYLDLAEALVERGADVNAVARNAMAVTPLHSAAAHTNPEKRRAIARFLLDRGADVNARQSGGFTALHAAAQVGDLELARLLIEKGADVNTKSDDGKTALDVALEKNRTEVAALLREQGATG